MAGEILGEVIRRLGRSAGLQGDLVQTDAQLLDRFARRRDEPAFSALLARHGPVVLGLCRRLLHDARDAEDAFQAVFLVLARKAGALPRQTLLGAWLYGVAWRVAVRLGGRAARRNQRERAGVDLDSLPADDAAWSDVGWVVQEEVRRLPDVYRNAVVLCCLEGKTNEEAALLLGRPVGTVKSRLTRARELLRARLTRRGMALSGGALTAVLAVRPAPTPAALLDATIHAAARFAVGEAVAGGLASARAVALTQEILRTMMLTKLKIAAALILAVAMLGGVGGLAYQAAAGQLGSDPNAVAKADQPKDQKPKDDRESIQGTWRVVAVESEGVVRDDEDARDQKTWTWIFRRDKLIVHIESPGPARDVKMTCILDPTQKPKAIDVTSDTGPQDPKERVLRGVYSVEGDTLKICYGMSDAEIEQSRKGFEGEPAGGEALNHAAGPRPKEFTTKAESKTTLLTLKREPVDKDKPADAHERPPQKDASGKADKPADDKDAIQGTWEVTGIERGGRQLLDTPLYKEFFPSKWIFTGDRLVLQATKEFPETAFTYTLDPSKTPKQMVKKKVSHGGAPAGQEEVIPSIYSVEDDTLKICTGAGKDRPTELAAPRVNQNELVTLRRVSSAAPAKEKPADSGEPSAGAGARGAKLLQEWREASNEAYRLHKEEFDKGKITPEVVIAAEQRLLEADLAGATTKAERVAAYQAHLGRVKDVMKVVNTKSDAGKIAPADVADVEAYLIKAEVLLEQEKAK